MAKKDPMQEMIERIQQGGEPQRPINPVGTPRPTSTPTPFQPTRGVGAAGGAFGGMVGSDVPAEKRNALQWLLDAIQRVRR